MLQKVMDSPSKMDGFKMINALGKVDGCKMVHRHMKSDVKIHGFKVVQEVMRSVGKWVVLACFKK